MAHIQTASASQRPGIIAALAASVTAYTVLCFLSRNLHPLPLWVFFCGFGFATLAYVWLYQRLPETLARADFRFIILGAILLRSIGFMGSPIYENDFYRYLWDGRTFAVTGDPYGKPPAASFNDETLPDPFPDILGRINYPDIPTIYGPVAELSFLLGYYISPGALWPLKLLYIAADLGTLWLLCRMMPLSRKLLLYAWSPLLIKEVAFTGHVDILAALCLVAVVYAFRYGRDAIGGLMLATGICARLSAGVLAPLLLKGRSKTAWAVAALASFAFYAPFVFRGIADGGGLGVFASEWEFNSFGYGLFAVVAGASAAKLICAVLFVSFYAWAWFRRPDLLRADVVLGVFFFLSPVVNPWYLVLLVPFVALRPSAWGIAATVSVLISYATGLNLGRSEMGPFDHPVWVRPLEIAPVLFGLVYGLKRKAAGTKLQKFEC